MMTGIQQTMGHRVQWSRVYSSTHRVDFVGVLLRMKRIECVARRTYSVPGPLHLVHININHMGLVIFGGIDSFSRKGIILSSLFSLLMYLGTATNNKASTALDICSEAVQKNGFPLRIERLWRDVWMTVSNVHNEILHSLENEGVVCPSNSIHLFCAQYMFLTRLQRDLDVLRVGIEDEDHFASEQDVTSPGVILPVIECPLSDASILHAVLRLQPMLDQLREGLQLYDLLLLIEQYPEICQP
ncbi:hypothetical protein FQN60_010524, partial [Etheostoma spectabile]